MTNSLSLLGLSTLPSFATAETAAQLAMPCVASTVFTATAPGLTSIEGGGDGGGGGGNEDKDSFAAYHLAPPHDRQWIKETQQRYGIYLPPALPMNKREVIVRFVRWTALWSAVAVFPRVTGIDWRIVYGLVMIPSAIHLFQYWHGSRHLKSYAEFLTEFKSMETRVWEHRQNIESLLQATSPYNPENESLFESLREALDQETRAMKQILSRLPDVSDSDRRNLAMGILFAASDFMRLIFPWKEDREQVPFFFEAIIRNHDDYLKRLPKTFPRNLVLTYRVRVDASEEEKLLLKAAEEEQAEMEQDSSKGIKK